MSLLISFQSEILKTKRTAAFYFTLVGAAIVPCTYLVNVAMDGIEDTKNDPFNALFKLGGEMNGLVFYPLFVVLICTLLPQIEYRNNTWKQVFTSPQTKANVFIAKYLNIHLLLLVFLVANLLFMFLAAVVAHLFMPEIDLLHQPLNVRRILVNSVNTYVTVLALSALQFSLGLRFKNFIVPTAVGLGLWLIGTIMVFEYHSTYAVYFPYSFHIFAVFPKMKSQLDQVEWTSLGYAASLLFVDFLDFRKRRMNA